MNRVARQNTNNFRSKTFFRNIQVKEIKRSASKEQIQYENRTIVIYDRLSRRRVVTKLVLILER